MKKRSITYYQRRVIEMDKLQDTEDKKVIKFIYILLKKYYTHKWEVYYDEKKKKSNKNKKTTYKGRYKTKEIQTS